MPASLSTECARSGKALSDSSGLGGVNPKGASYVPCAKSCIVVLFPTSQCAQALGKTLLPISVGQDSA